MNALDIILLLCFVPAVIRGLSKGFLEQFLTLAGVVVGVWASFKFSSFVSEIIRPYIEASDTMLNAAAFAIILVVVCVLAFLLSKALTKIIRTSLLSWVDKLLGVIAGVLVTGLALAALAVSSEAISGAMELGDAEILKNSKVYNFLKDAAYIVFPYLKSLLLKS